MWQEPIVKERIQTALKEGLTSQSATRVKRDPSRWYSYINESIHRIRRLLNKKTHQTEQTQNAFGFQQPKETIR